MKDYNEECFINSDGLGIVVRVDKENKYATFTPYEGIRLCLTNPLKIRDGRTIGQANRDQLHELLDKFLDAHL